MKVEEDLKLIIYKAARPRLVWALLAIASAWCICNVHGRRLFAQQAAPEQRQKEIVPEDRHHEAIADITGNRGWFR